MTTLIASDKTTLVIGLGKTGYSCVRYLAERGHAVQVADTRDNPPYLAELRERFPQVPVQLGPLDAQWLCQADELIVSPGLSLQEPAIAQALAAGIPVLGDIDLFCRAAQAPIVAITGSNAKSTVTTLVGEMAAQAGLRVGVGGNLGTPVLELLEGEPKELFVLELSSFQLETTHQLAAEVATVLNMSPDHLDRYADMQAYHWAKHRIFRNARQVVVNRDDPLSEPLVSAQVKRWSFGLGKPDLASFGVIEQDTETWLAFGLQPLLPASELLLPGSHGIANALAALALGHAVGLPMPAMLETLRRFRGLPHRCQWVAEIDGVAYYNDSKGTNVGATLAALQGLGECCQGKLVLIAGGDGKGADFAALAPPLARWGRAAVLLGQDAPALQRALADSLPCRRVDTLTAAVQQARRLAQPGDIVLLSPACSSLDMFKNFEQRGELFIRAVKALSA